ncbi:MAG: tetratricopeptide repeat protein [Hydrogenophaga sp.]|jgi:predicted negative regulator of RcsB-dependent stress response|nr:tetratricopeptide repeat protein [Hydrogenophaga sp.]
MAKHLDLEEQEQLDQIKHFWARYGNAISWVLIVVFGSIAAYNGWNWYQRNQGAKAAALYEELDRAVVAKDLARVERVLGDLRSGFAGTTFAAQGGLLAGKALFEGGQADKAREALQAVVDAAGDEGLQAVARLRLASVELEAGRADAALQLLQAKAPAAFEPLMADRRGDVLMAQGKADEARAQYEAAWKAMPPGDQLRRLIAIKLAALGVAVEPEARS